MYFMSGLTRIISLFVSFCLGFGLCAGILIGAPAAALATFKLRDLEKSEIVQIDGKYIDTSNADVDILNLTAIGMFKEFQELEKFGSEVVSLDFIVDRYGLKIYEDEQISKLLPEGARSMPIKKLLSMEGVNTVCETIYIGDLEKYELCDAEGNPSNGDPKAEDTFWYHNGKQISGLQQIIADFNLADFLNGGINTDDLFHQVCLGDVFGYVLGEDGKYYHEDGTPVDGLMSSLAECHISDVGSKIETMKIGELMSYKQSGLEGEEDIWYEEKTDEEGNIIYDENGDAVLTQVHPFMNLIAGKTIDSISDVFDEMTIGDLVPEEDRTGIFAIIPPDTHFDNLSAAINESIMGSPLQFFMNQNLISFADASGTLDKMCTYNDDPFATQPDYDATMDLIYWNAYKDKNLYAYILEVEEGQPGYDEFLELKGYYEFDVVTDEEGNVTSTPLWEEREHDGVTYYRVPAWRTRPLNESFGYIILLLSGAAEAEPNHENPLNAPKLEE